MTGQRVLTAALLGPLAIAAVLWLPTPILAALLAIVFLLGLWEWTRLVGLTHVLPRVGVLTAGAAIMAVLTWSARPGGLFPFQLTLLIGAGWWLLAALWLRRFEFMRQATASARGIKLLAGLLATVPAWCALVLLHADGELGPRWALLALSLIWAADTGAYFAGIRYGTTRLAPRISPGKTWAGLWGGVGASLLVAVLAAPLLGLGLAQLPALLLLSAIAVGFSVVGDLYESLLKRHAGCKDSGDLIPGHGGVLDRIDSLLAALPAFALGKAWLGL
ncbi:MAG: phosphatidate cytidylyltransferase [Rehaibacterium terrae]|uniref:phosphatidate cytidylyltransferase n=1 Tax=Rehaibacterium terrae TaxID=1341696 RepID=UPI00391B28A9